MIDPKAHLGAAHDPTLDYRWINLRRRHEAPLGWTSTGQTVGELTLVSRPRPVVVATAPVVKAPLPPKAAPTTPTTGRGLFQRKGTTR